MFGATDVEKIFGLARAKQQKKNIGMIENINIRFVSVNKNERSLFQMIIKRCFWRESPEDTQNIRIAFLRLTWNLIPLFSSSMFQNGKNRRKNQKIAHFLLEFEGRWLKTSCFSLSLSLYLWVLVFLFGSDRFSVRFSSSNSFLSTATILREYVRGRERHNWGIIGLWCLFFLLLCDIRPRDVQVFLSNAKGIRRKENKTRKIAHWQLTILLCLLLPVVYRSELFPLWSHGCAFLTKQQFFGFHFFRDACIFGDMHQQKWRT